VETANFAVIRVCIVWRMCHCNRSVIWSEIIISSLLFSSRTAVIKTCAWK